MAFAAALLPVLSAVGTAASVAAPIIGGFYQGQVASNNAQVEKQNAEYATEAGQQQAAATSLKGAAKTAGVKSGIAANNVDVNSGSAVDVEGSERGANQLDADTVLSNANLQAYGYTVQSQNDQAQATQDEVGGVLKGVGGLVGNASSLPFSWGGAGNSSGGSGLTADNWGG